MSEPRRLFVVRHRQFGRSAGSSPPNTDGHMIGVFATREQAEVRLAEAEVEAARSGDFWPIYYEENLDGLMAHSDFEPGVFRDWMADHDIPDPASVLPLVKRHECPWYVWLKGLGKEKLARLYEAMHHFRFCEIVEIPLNEEPLPESAWDYPEAHVTPDPPGLYTYPPLDDEEPQ
jgi:hypothetical protein